MLEPSIRVYLSFGNSSFFKVSLLSLQAPCGGLRYFNVGRAARISRIFCSSQVSRRVTLASWPSFMTNHGWSHPFFVVPVIPGLLRCLGGYVRLEEIRLGSSPVSTGRRINIDAGRVIVRDWMHSCRSLIVQSKFLRWIYLSSIATSSFLSCQSFPMSFKSRLVPLTLDNTSISNIFLIFLRIWMLLGISSP